VKTLTFCKNLCKEINFSKIFIGLTLFIFLIITCLVVNSAVVFATNNNKLSQKKISQKKSDILHVTSDTMISDRNAGFIDFSGNACATNRDSVIKADSIKIFLYKQNEHPSPRDKQQNIKKIIASGKVQYTSGNKRAFADKAVYTTKTQILVLTGKAPSVTMGNSFVTGKKITLFQKSSKVIVESGKHRRVEALFNSKDRIKNTKK